MVATTGKQPKGLEQEPETEQCTYIASQCFLCVVIQGQITFPLDIATGQAKILVM